MPRTFLRQRVTEATPVEPQPPPLKAPDESSPDESPHNDVGVSFIPVPLPWLTALVKGTEATRRRFAEEVLPGYLSSFESFATTVAPKLYREHPPLGNGGDGDTEYRDFHRRFVAMVETELPEASQPTASQVRGVWELIDGTAVDDEALGNIAWLLRKFAVGKPGYTGHVSGLLTALRRDGWAKLRSDAAAYAKQAVKAPEVLSSQRNATNEKLAKEPLPVQNDRMERLRNLRQRVVGS